MEGSGTLTGLAPKEKAEGQFIEIKMMVRFEPSVLSELGMFFGKQINFQIESQQQDLDFEPEGEYVDETQLEIEQRR